MTWTGLERIGGRLSPWFELDRLTGSLLAEPANVEYHPALNIWASDEELVVTAELPGLSKDNIDITVQDERLTIKGTYKQDQKAPESGKYLRRERKHRDFTKTLRLPFKADPEAVKASLKHGVLRVELARAEEDKPRKITVKAA